MYINIYHILYVYKLLADSQEETPLSLLGYFISSLRFIWPCISPADPLLAVTSSTDWGETSTVGL